MAEETPCPEREDMIHCVHWYDGARVALVATIPITGWTATATELRNIQGEGRLRVWTTTR